MSVGGFGLQTWIELQSVARVRARFAAVCPDPIAMSRQACSPGATVGRRKSALASPLSRMKPPAVVGVVVGFLWSRAARVSATTSRAGQAPWACVVELLDEPLGVNAHAASAALAA